jgi:hypothetical protein
VTAAASSTTAACSAIHAAASPAAARRAAAAARPAAREAGQATGHARRGRRQARLASARPLARRAPAACRLRRTQDACGLSMTRNALPMSSVAKLTGAKLTSGSETASMSSVTGGAHARQGRRARTDGVRRARTRAGARVGAGRSRRGEPGSSALHGKERDQQRERERGKARRAGSARGARRRSRGCHRRARGEAALDWRVRDWMHVCDASAHTLDQEGERVPWQARELGSSLGKVLWLNGGCREGGPGRKQSGRRCASVELASSREGGEQLRTLRAACAVRRGCGNGRYPHQETASRSGSWASLRRSATGGAKGAHRTKST